METMIFDIETMMNQFQAMVMTALTMVMLIPVVIGGIYTVVKLVFSY